MTVVYDSVSRRCGGCQLCCKLVPVREIGKKAGVACEHQSHARGCSIYERRPLGCVLWSCSWLLSEPGTQDMSRPDRSRYIIDPMPDEVSAAGQRIPAVQIWVDPKHPDAWKDPALLIFLEGKAREGIVAIIRYSSRDGFTLFAPSLCPDGQWHEVKSNIHPTQDAYEQKTRRDEAQVSSAGPAQSPLE